MKKIITALSTLSLALSFAAPVGAVDLSVDPWVYNPDNLTGVTAQWQPLVGENKPENKDACKNGGYVNYTDANGDPFKNQGLCISYFNNTPINQVLFLEKDMLTSGNAAAGAEVLGVEGLVLTELGFDYQGYCGAGAPRFNVYTEGGSYYFFGCTYGTHTDLGDGWTRVRFSNADAFPVGDPFPGFGTIVISGIDIVQDEGPASVMLDNIDVNGVLIGNP